MSEDDVPTVVDASRGGGKRGDPHDATTHVVTPSTYTSLGAATIDVGEPETVLREAEIEQTRRTAISGLVFNAVGLVCAPFFGGDPTAHRLFIAGLAVGWLANAWLLYVSRTDERYRESHVVIYFVMAPFFNAAIMYYVGVFGPIVVIFVLNLYSVCLGYGRRVARVTLVASILPMLVLGGAMALGLLDDPGLITVTEPLGRAGRAVLVVCFVAFLGLSYSHARNTRKAMVASLQERDRAVRRASHREALLLEARQDLENALRAGGLGRFSEQTLGSFKLGAVIGRGGMGEIYEATHTESGDPAAIKMLLPEVLGRPEYVRRFLREVRIAASLESPHVVRVLEVGDEKAPLPYLAMERLVGEDLAQILRREGRLKSKRMLDLVRQVGRGLAAANEAGIVHRDLKPQNLFLTRDEGVWKILDFGISKLSAGEGGLTRGDAVGTPHYMAPEQARGEAVDGRADLFSLGAIAYRALTGHQPFKGSEAGVILVSVIGAMPVRPSALAPLHRDVDRALAIALAKQPDDRFASADELADALGAAIRGSFPGDLCERADALLAAMPWSEP